MVVMEDLVMVFMADPYMVDMEEKVMVAMEDMVMVDIKDLAMEELATAVMDHMVTVDMALLGMEDMVLVALEGMVMVDMERMVIVATEGMVSGTMITVTDMVIMMTMMRNVKKVQFPLTANCLQTKENVKDHSSNSFTIKQKKSASSLRTRAVGAMTIVLILKKIVRKSVNLRFARKSPRKGSMVDMGKDGITLMQTSTKRSTTLTDTWIIPIY